MSLLKINIAGAKRAAARVHRSVPPSPPTPLAAAAEAAPGVHGSIGSEGPEHTYTSTRGNFMNI